MLLVLLLAVVVLLCLHGTMPGAFAVLRLMEEPPNRRRMNLDQDCTADEAVAECGSSQLFGPLYARHDEQTPLADAASQMLSLCLKWWRRSESMTQSKIRTLQSLWARRIGCGSSDELQPQQHFSLSLVCTLLEHWKTATLDEHGAKQKAGQQQHALALRQHADAFVLALRGEGFPTINGWSKARIQCYIDFLLEEVERAQYRELFMTPLRYVLTEYEPLLRLPTGLWLEFGVADGHSLRFIAEHIDVHLTRGASIAGECCFGFDSFKGLPEDWRPGFPAGQFARQQPLALPSGCRAQLVEGWFEDTLVDFLEEHPEPVAMLHLDCDIYSSASFVLRTLHEHSRLRDGTVIIFDELFNYCGFENHELLALFETMELGLRFCWLGVRQRGSRQAALAVTCSTQ